MAQEPKKQIITIRGTIERYDHANKLVEILCDPALAVIDKLEINLANLPVRVKNALINMRIVTYGDLLTYSKRDFFRYRNFGLISLNTLEKHLAERRLYLREE